MTMQEIIIIANKTADFLYWLRKDVLNNYCLLGRIEAYYDNLQLEMRELSKLNAKI